MWCWLQLSHYRNGICVRFYVSLLTFIEQVYIFLFAHTYYCHMYVQGIIQKFFFTYLSVR